MVPVSMRYIHHKLLIQLLQKTDYLISIPVKQQHQQDGVFPYIIQQQEIIKVIIVLIILIMVIGLLSKYHNK